MGVAAVFHGEPLELHALLAAVAHHCTCDLAHPGNRPAHRALLNQHFLDHILFARHLAERLLAEEFRA